MDSIGKMSDSRTFSFVSDGTIPEGIRRKIGDVVRENVGTHFQLTLAKKEKNSSTSQREYYFAVIVPAWQKILQDANDEYWDKDDTHDFLMEEIGGWFKPLKKGQKHPSRRSYKKLTTAEAEKHHALCIAAAAQEHVIIPMPNEGLTYVADGS